MSRQEPPWDYLILTASNERQAAAYESQLRLRREAGQLADVRETLVLADPEGRRIGSGGSTLLCLRTVVERETERGEDIEATLRRLRILIVHAGGDSRRLPAYGVCGKIFVPVPGESQGGLGLTLFDLLVPDFLALPGGRRGAGQVLVAAGDALIRFDAAAVRFHAEGVTALGCAASPEEAARHGVFCGDSGGGLVRLYLQKPSVEAQSAMGATDARGRTTLDVGVMNFDGSSAAALLRAIPPQDAILEHGLDLYREICCAMGSEATEEHYLRSARASGSTWSEAELRAIYPALRAIPFQVETVPECRFLHLGSTRQLIESGSALGAGGTLLIMDTDVASGGGATGAESWVEGCRLSAPLTLSGRNVLVGVDVTAPLTLPRGACLDVVQGETEWFYRCYGVDDDFKRPAAQAGMFCGRPILEWLAKAGVPPECVWDPKINSIERSLWNARVFPAGPDAEGYRRWLWMFEVEGASAADKEAYLASPRQSVEEIAQLADQNAFHMRRTEIRAEAALRQASDAAGERWRGRIESLAECRALCVLGSAVEILSPGGCVAMNEAPVSLRARRNETPAEWSQRLRELAFHRLNEIIFASSVGKCVDPRNALRPGETIWGRAPARIELGGGWTDTPPYTLERGGDVANVAVNLNGQPPIHCYCRVVEDPVVRLASIDGGARLEIAEMEELLDYRRPGDRFALAKAALAISGFAPAGACLREVLRRFGGGIELTTLVGIPKGSGLGTSSILGTVILGVVQRMTGRPLNQRELFHDVLRLEQALTTGGGWQDQVGGGVGGTKLTCTQPGMQPDPQVRLLPDDLIDPRLNGGATLLYYTGLTRLAKNILEKVVGGYLDRDRRIMAALAEEHVVAHAIADALSRKDAVAFGRHVDFAWELQKRLCGTVTNETIEQLLNEVRPYVHGMRISGAGSGGFLLMICKSPGDAARVRRILEEKPLNERSRFFDFEVNAKGLEVATC